MGFHDVRSLFQDHPRRAIVMMPARTGALLEDDLLKLHDCGDLRRRHCERSRHRLQERNARDRLLKSPGRTRCKGHAETGCNFQAATGDRNLISLHGTVPPSFVSGLPSREIVDRLACAFNRKQLTIPYLSSVAASCSVSCDNPRKPVSMRTAHQGAHEFELDLGRYELRRHRGVSSSKRKQWSS